MRVLEKLADRTGYLGSNTKRSIIGGDLNLPHADWYGHAEKSSGTQVFLNRLLWENGYSRVWEYSLLDLYPVRPERSFATCSNVQRISDHCGVLLEVEWVENCSQHQVESLVPVCTIKQTPQVYKVSSGVNSHHGQQMVVVWRNFGNVLRKLSSRLSIVLSHIKFWEKKFWSWILQYGSETA